MSRADTVHSFHFFSFFFLSFPFLSLFACVSSAVESGSNPNILRMRLRDDIVAHGEQVRGQVLGVTLLRDQLQLRINLWDEALAQQAAKGDAQAKQLLQDTRQTHTDPVPFG